MKPRRAPPEFLEPRIAPATLTGHVLTYTDIDGDRVAVTISKGTIAPTMFTFDTGSVDGDNTVKQQLQLIDLSSATGVGGADITVKVTRAGGGDGLAAIGRINAGINDLGHVTIKGDLGVIDAGSGSETTPAIKSLALRSMGVYGLATQGGTGDLESDILGALGSLRVVGDVKDAFVFVSGGTFASIGVLTIGGSLIGASGNSAARIECTGNIGPIQIGHDVHGGSGSYSAQISASGKIASVRV